LCGNLAAFFRNAFVTFFIEKDSKGFLILKTDLLISDDRANFPEEKVILPRSWTSLTHRNFRRRRDGKRESPAPALV
jgi:hypothetical protein